VSGEAKRAIQGAALLEVDEAKAALALLRARAQQWGGLHQKVTWLLARMTRESAHLEDGAKEVRAEIEDNIDSYVSVTKIEAVLSLDKELETAVERLKKAESVRKSLGFA
jgi:hypothetical protein